MHSQNLDLNSAGSNDAGNLNGNALPLEREGDNYLDMVLRKEIHRWFKNHHLQDYHPHIGAHDNFRAIERASAAASPRNNGR